MEINVPSRQECRMTRQRQTILEEIRKVDSHPSADEIYEMVRRRLPRISLGTVYRNLEVLSDCGMIQKLDLGTSQRRFDGKMDDHYHVRCIRCNRVEDVPVAPASKLEEALRKVSDYDITGHRLEFVGLCPKCKKRERKPDAG
ncbi:MAG: transcriptional repressor [Candidatus Hydrogenedentota bacterium]|nr:MAG: transcriptional repressor [Candidatus Hydrogenedentota bacterium]